MAQKVTSPLEEPSWEECIQILDELPGLPLEQRILAVERLVRNSSPGIRGRALRMGAAFLSDDILTSYLRNDDDGVLRNAGLEMLKMRGHRGFSLAVLLPKDPDFDVALQAVLVLDHLKDPRALEPLRGLLRHSDPNVVQAVIVAIGHLGDARAIPDLLPFLEADSWLQLAAVEALGDIRSPAAVEPLAGLLTDLIVGPFAAEALARIGGPAAYRRLANHWLRFENELDAETMLGLIAHVLEGLPEFPEPVVHLRDSLARYLREGEGGEPLASARSLLALGPGPEDGESLDLLVAHTQEPTLLPACLAQRKDLMARLLSEDDARRAWGFLLCARFPDSAPAAELTRALRPPLEPEWLDLVVLGLAKIRSRPVSSSLLELYLSLPAAVRGKLAPLLSDDGGQLQALLDERTDLPREGRLVLGALLGRDPQAVSEEIQALPDTARAEVLPQLADQEAVMRRLPWSEWLEAKPEVYGPLAAEAAVESGLRGLLPQLRQLLASQPSPELIRALGELGDRESVPGLVALLPVAGADGQDAVFGPVVLESLGRIGGPEVRSALRQVAESEDENLSRIAYRALSKCATEEDDELFRRAVGSHDWYVRLACADVLGRFQRPENLSALAQLAADPMPIVAQRSLSFLESEGGGK